MKVDKCEEAHGGEYVKNNRILVDAVFVVKYLTLETKLINTQETHMQVLWLKSFFELWNEKTCCASKSADNVIKKHEAKHM